jgi:hypothetical protein
MTMLVHIHHEGRVYEIEAPAGARVVQSSADDCLVYRWDRRTEYLLTPFAVLCARDGARGLRLLRAMPEEA